MANNTRHTAAKNLPIIMSQSVIGLVLRISKVPWLISSENDLIVIAAIKNMKTQGAIKNSTSRLACPWANTFPSENTQVNKPMINKKTMITT